MKILVVSLCFILWGCARVDVRTPEPIKINMRIDVYQHVVKEVESLEDQVYGENTEKMNRLTPFIAVAYAQEVAEVDLQVIVSRRRERRETVEEFMDKGYIGENRDGLLVVMGGIPADIAGKVRQLVDEENTDRLKMYEILAQKNGVSLSEIKKVVFQDHLKRAKSGWWFEVYENESFIWKKK